MHIETYILYVCPVHVPNFWKIHLSLIQNPFSFVANSKEMDAHPNVKLSNPYLPIIIAIVNGQIYH